MALSVAFASEFLDEQFLSCFLPANKVSQYPGDA